MGRWATVWRARGWSRPGRATRWRWPSTSGAAASRHPPFAGTHAPGRGRGGATTGARALRLIQAEAHVWRGELAEAERQALAAAEALAPGGAAWLRAQSEAIIAAGKHGRLDVVERQVRLAGDTPPGAGGAPPHAPTHCASRAAGAAVVVG